VVGDEGSSTVANEFLAPLGFLAAADWADIVVGSNVWLGSRATGPGGVDLTASVGG
jgi:hypothetical protein